MIYTKEELGNELPEIIKHLNSLNDMNKEQLLIELNMYKKMLSDLKSNSKSQKAKYTLAIFIYNILNKLSNNEYVPIIYDLKSLKSEATYELSCINKLNCIINYLKKFNCFEDIDVLYITLISISQLHNNRCEFSNNLADTYDSVFNGFNAYIPTREDYKDKQLKNEIDNSINYLVKKIC